MPELHTSRQASDDEIDLLTLLGLLWDGRWWVIFASVFGVLVGVIYAGTQTPIYSANSLVQVETNQSGLLAVDQLSKLITSNGGVAAEIELVRSRFVLGKVVDELGLDVAIFPKYFPVFGETLASRFSAAEGALADSMLGKEYAWGGETLELGSLTVPRNMIGRALTLVSTSDGWQLYASSDMTDLVCEGTITKAVCAEGYALNVVKLVASPGTHFSVLKLPRQTAILGLQSGLRIAEERPDSGMLRLRFEDADREKAVRILDAIGRSFVQQNIERSSAAVGQSLDFLKATLPGVKEELETAERRLNEYQARSATINIDSEAKILLGESVAQKKKLEELKLKSHEIQRLFQPSHPKYREWLFQIKQQEQRLNEIDEQISLLPETHQELIRLRRDVEVGNEIYLQMLSNIQQLNIAKAGAVGNVRVVDNAIATLSPVKPRKSVMIVAGGVAGLTLGCFLVAIRSVFRRGVENPDLIERMGLPVYAGIPFSKEQQNLEAGVRKKGKALAGRHRDPILLSISSPEDPAVEAIRSLRTSLHFAMLEAGNNILMISGPSTNVGKTFVSANLAAVLAQAGQSVLLIDADLRRGSAHRLLNVDNQHGLASILLDQTSFEDTVIETPVKGLSFIPRGTAPVSPSELLMSERLESLLKETRKQYDLVIVDTPPILAVTDAAIVGKYAGTTMLVTRFGSNSVKELELTRRRFELNGILVKGVVLNAIVKKASAYGYSSYRYYNYSYKSDNQS